MKANGYFSLYGKQFPKSVNFEASFFEYDMRYYDTTDITSLEANTLIQDSFIAVIANMEQRANVPQDTEPWLQVNE